MFTICIQHLLYLFNVFFGNVDIKKQVSSAGLQIADLC